MPTINKSVFLTFGWLLLLGLVSGMIGDHDPDVPVAGSRRVS
jgi:hypothetical protein